MSSHNASLSFNVSVPTDALDILAFLGFCKKRGVHLPKGYDCTSVAALYTKAFHEGETFTPAQFLDSHGKNHEILDYMLLLQEETVDHWQSEFDCWEPDHPECSHIQAEWLKSRAGLDRVKAFRAAVLEAED